MIVTPHLISWIKDRLASKGWDIAALSRNTETSAPGWSRILNGQSASLRARAIEDLCTAFGVNEIELYYAANPDAAIPRHTALESKPRYGYSDALTSFIAHDIEKYPAHRSAYEAIAVAFGFKKGPS